MTNAFKKIFIDTSPLIYYLQKDARYFSKMKEILISFYNTGSKLALSDITIAEYCVFPYKNNRNDLIDSLDNFIKVSNAEILHTTKEIAKKTAKIRAEFPKFKTMDSLQLALAITNRCDAFLTNDKQLKQYKSISCITVDVWKTA